VILDDGCELLGDELLVAVGRTPDTADLGLETVGLQPGG
jgi:dihydrolipoamide dehydrogenase